MFGEVAHRQFGARMPLRPVQDVVDRDVFQREPDDAPGNVVKLGRQVDPLAGSFDPVADHRRHDEDVTEHHEHQDGEHALFDDS